MSWNDALDQAAAALLDVRDELEADAHNETDTGGLSRAALGAYDPKSGDYLALATALANSPHASGRSPGASRAALEAELGRRIDVIAIHCTGHAVNGAVKRPRIAYAARMSAEVGWYFGATLSAAVDLFTRAAQTPAANAARTASYLAKQSSGHERDVIYCQECDDSFVFAHGRRIARALESFLTNGQHTVSLGELRDRY